MATLSWKNAANGNWNLAANWTPGTVPSSADIAQITIAGTYTVLLTNARTLTGLTLGATSGIQTLGINGNILTLNGASTVSNNGVLNLASGTVNGTGALTVSNLLNWNGGTLSGTGKKTVSGKLNLSGDQTLDKTTLETTGATVWTGNGTLSAANAATWNNTSTGTIDLQSDADFYQSTGAQSTFNNAGTLTKSNGTTTDESYISGIFNNTGTVQVKAGTLRLSGGGTNTGSFSIDNGATLKLSSNYNFNTGNSITGAGNFNIEGGTTTVAAASTWSAPVNLTSSGTITGTGALTISNKLNWSGEGTLSGTGKKTVSGTLNLSGGHLLGGTTLETTGTTIWTGNGTLYTGDGAIWNNTSTGTIDLQDDADFYQWYGNLSTFNNAGTLIKSNGTTTGESSISGLFNNTGTVQVKAGTLTLYSGGTNTGSFSIDAGSTLNITGNADYNFNTGTNITGVGNFVVSYVTVKIVPAFNYSGAVFVNNSGNLDIGAASTLSAPVNLTEGNLTGTGALTISNQLNWNSGTLSGTGKKTVSGTLNILSKEYSEQVIIGTTLETTGATVWTGNGTFYAQNGAIWNNTSTGTIDLQNDADFSFVYDNPISTFNNAGTFTKSNGTTTDDSFIDAIFNNTGTVQVKAGTLRLIGGGNRGTNTGNFSIDAGATLRITADYYNFNAGNSVTGAGNFNIESGIATTVAAASTWSAPVNLISGNLTGAGALTISNQLNWSGGTLSGTGKKTVSGALNLSGNPYLDGTTLETSGATVWSGNGTIYANSAAIWNNTSTGTIDLQNDADFVQNGGNKPTFNNAGTLTKSNGRTDDESYISGFFNNTGTVKVKAGTLNLGGGGTNTGSFSIDAGATLRITADYNFNTGTNITGVGNFVVGEYATVKIIPAFNYSGAVYVNRGGNLDIGAASTWSAPVNLIAATLTGAGALTISNQLNWSGSVLSGTGKKTVTGTLNLSSNQYLDGTTLETSGATVWIGNSTFYANNGAIWNNTSTGTIDLQNDSDFSQQGGNQSTFNNAGTFTKSNGTTTDDSFIGFVFNNTGTVKVKAGTLTLYGGGTNTGNFSIDAGGTLRIIADYNFNTGNSVTGAGNFNIETGPTTVNVDSTWSAPVNLIGGTLTGAGALTVSNLLNWNGGTLSGTGKKTVSGTLNLSGSQTLDGTTLETTGATVWTGNGTLSAINAATWNNTSTGTIDLQSDADFYYWYGAQPTFNNAGTLTKSNGTTTDESYISGIFNNTGTVQVKKGTLRLSGGGTNTGSFSIDNGATLKLSSDYNFNAGNSVTGAGKFNIESGITTVNTASTWLAPVNLVGGNLTGAGALTVSNLLNWNGGTLSGTGKKTVSGTLNLSGSQTLDGTTLETTGATVWTGNGTLSAINAATWNNTSTGTIDLQSDADFYYWYGAQPTFNNAGTLTKSNGTTTDESYISGIFNNTGTVQVKKGTLRLSGGGTNTGSFSIDNGATLKLSSDYNFNAGNSVTGAGKFNIESGITTVNTASTWLAPVNLVGGNLTGAGALTVSNLLNWNGGTLSGTGKKTVSGTLNLSGSQTLDGTTLETTGATVWTGNGTLSAINAATWNNTSTGTIDLQGDADFYYWYDGQPTFNNAGTLTKSNGTTTDNSYIDAIFNNTGTVQVNKGRLRFTGSYTQTAGTTNISGGSLAFENSPLNLQGGTLNGTGTITGSVSNSGGQINPGNNLGILNITGDYSQTAAGTLNLELGSATSFDKFNITGAADLGGILKLNLTSGYTPTIGTKFAVLTYGSATTKTFNTIQGIDISSSLAFAPTSTGNNLTLEVVDQVKDLGAINFSNPQTVTDFVGDTDLSDFYRFNVTTASNVQVKLTNLTTNADVWLVDGLGRTIAKGTKTGTADELFNWAVDTGTYYVKVFRPAAGNNTNYTLQVATSTAIWPVQFGTSGQERNSGVSNDRAGSVFAAGFTTGAFAGNTNAGDADGYISKYNPDGSQAWVKQFGTSGTDYAIGTGNDNAGNVYSTGYTNGAFTGATNLGSNDGFITKYTSTGTLAWVKQFGTAADDTSFGISVDSNGNSYIVGKTYGAFAGNITQGAYDAYIAKYDTNGTQTWIKQFGTNQDDETIGVSIDSNDNIYVLGSTVGAFAGNTNASGYDVFVSKYNSSGTQAWVKQLGSSGNNYANINGISTDSTGNVFITGFTDGTFSGNTSLGSYDGFVAKYSTTGTLAWVKQFGTTSEDYSAASKTDSVGNTYVTGWTGGQFTGNTALGGYDGFLAKYNTSGTRLWVKQFGTNSNDYANGLSIDNLGNIYISGWTEGSFPTYTNQGGTDSYIALFDTNGNQLSIPAIPAVITVAATDADAGETATGVTPNPGTFTLTRTNDLTKAITVNYTLSGSATNGTDYSNLTGTVSFAAGASTAIVTVTPTDDNIFEVTETAVLTLTSGTGYILGTTSSATVNITDNDPQPTISINDVAVIEGNSGTTNATFTVTLSNTSSQTITVNYATADGTATTADLDYNAANATISFAPGEISKTVTVAVVGDTKSENPEAFTVNLSNVTNATITKATGVGTITNDDLPIITVATTDSDAGETATGITPNPGAFTVTRNGDLTQAITVNYTLSDSATNGTDYNSLPGTINFAAGDSTAIVTVTPTDDNIFEGTETAILTLTTGTGYNLDVTNSATVNIADNDLPSISLAVSPASVAEDGPTNLVYTFTRTGTTANALTVNYGVGGTATFNTDYTQTGATSLTATTGTITFAAGSSNATLTIDPTADTTVEPDETVVLTLATATGYTVNTTTAVTGTITNDDSSALPVITVAATANAAETATGVTPNLGVFTLTRLGGNINQPLTVTYSLTGTATNGADYTTVANNVIFAAGSNTATVTLTPIDDTIFEGTETAILTLVKGTAYILGTTANATVSIADNDLQPTANLSATKTIVEGNTNPQNVTYTVTLSNTSTKAITVNYATADGTAKAGLDYTSTTGSLTFNPGVKTQVINIPILNDALNEANETFNLNLTSATNATLGATKTVATTITDTLTATITTTLPDGVENLTLTGTSAINGTGNAGNNVFTGNSGNNTLTGLDGNDTYVFSVIGALGTDTIVETATGGIDTIDLTGTTAAVNVNLAVTTSQTVNSNLKLILSGNNVIENVTGGAGNDRLTGNALDNLLVGGAGNDKLQGLAGNDSLWGGLGDDILTGEVGNDQYLFQNNGVFSTALGVDYIPQFDAGQDKIVLSLSTFNAITNTVGQALSDFAVVTDDELVNASNARIVYSQSTGSLFYNQDGNVLGAGKVFEFAQLGNLDITLSGSDFSLIA